MKQRKFILSAAAVLTVTAALALYMKTTVKVQVEDGVVALSDADMVTGNADRLALEIIADDGKETIIANGEIGTVQWAIDTDGIMTLSGKGTADYHVGSIIKQYDVEKLVIGGDITGIGENVFSSCGSLIDITVAEKNTYFQDIDGVLFNEDSTVLIAYPSGRKNTDYTVPSGVVSIANQAFSGCGNLVNVELPDSVTHITDFAFAGCENLAHLNLPNGVTNIGNYAFADCSHLTDVEIPADIVSIGENAFM